MTELGQTILANAEKLLAGYVYNDRKLKRLGKQIRDGTIDYEVANEYAVRLGELTSQALKKSTNGLAFMSEEVADEVFTPLLTHNHDLMVTVTDQLQKNINASNGLGIRPVTPELDTNRITGIVKKVASYDTLEGSEWMLGEPVINYTQAITDQAIRDNATANDAMGLQAKIIRETGPSETRTITRGKYTASYKIPCQWCEDLAGTYDYADVKATGSDVYRRHENCRCIVTYQQGANRQDVWSKTTWTEQDAERRSELISARMDELARTRQAEAERKATRRSNVDLVSSELGYSAKGASIWLNANKADIEKYGIEYMLDLTRNLNNRALRAALS